MQDGGRLWQPYTDFLVMTALMAVPWGGPEMYQFKSLRMRGGILIDWGQQNGSTKVDLMVDNLKTGKEWISPQYK